MKQRISSLDIKLLIAELRSLLKGQRLHNVYNLSSNPRSFLLKFSIPDSKVSVAVESGLKLYATEYQLPTLPQPSNFNVKLRKHLKSKRLTDIRQVGNDRVVVMQFSEGMYYLVFEFFSAGNILLLDSDHKILTLFRFVDNHHTQSGFDYSVGQVYPVFDDTLFKEEPKLPENHQFSSDEVLGWVEQSQAKSAKKVPSVHKLCFVNASYLSSDLIQIYLRNHDAKPSSSCLTLKDDQLRDQVVIALNESQERYMRLLQTPNGELDGYILRKKNALFDDTREASDDNLEYTYEEFHPYNPTHKETPETKVEEIKGYNHTLDKFFTMIELSKASLSRQKQKAAATKRLNLVREENAKKLAQLDSIQELNIKKGDLITLYSAEIEECRLSVQELLDQQMDWTNIDKLIDVERRRGNPTAKMIKSLNLLKNEITVSLPDQDVDDSDSESDGESDSDSDSDSDGDSETSSTQTSPNTTNVVIDLGQSAFANASTYFDAKKSAQVKQKKTEKNAVLAIKNSEQKVQQDLKRLANQTKNTVEIKRLRPKLWFEKFYWFISGDGYLCIAGADFLQVDMIYYRYFNNESDILVSSDLENALQVVIKNPYKNKDMPPSTLIQAGIYALSNTKAWESKMSTSPWWVKGKSVSKKDFDGSILRPGLLNISGEKQFLPPCQMVMGLGLFWVGDAATTKKYEDAMSERDESVGLEYVDGQEGSRLKVKELSAMLDKLALKQAPEVAEASAEVTEATEATEATEVTEVTEPAETTEISSVAQTSSVSETSNAQTEPVNKVRGKKGKLKKMKKYVDQDDEERRLRMAALGTLKQVDQKAEKDAQADTVVNKAQEAALRKERKAQQQTRQLRKILDEVEQSEAGAEPYYREISGLIRAPHKTDVVEDCIVTFAPWSSFSKFTYKVKVVPGTLKRGKTFNGAMEQFKKKTKSLQKDGAEWWDQTGIIETISEQESLMSMTGTRYKLGNDQGGNSGKFSGNSKSKSKGGKKKSNKAKGRK